MFQTKGDEVHKLAERVRYPEDEEILRVPIALAMIKLLQNLPKGTLENRLPGSVIGFCLLGLTWPKVGQIGPKWDKSETFSDQIAVHFGSPR